MTSSDNNMDVDVLDDAEIRYMKAQLNGSQQALLAKAKLTEAQTEFNNKHVQSQIDALDAYAKENFTVEKMLEHIVKIAPPSPRFKVVSDYTTAFSHMDPEMIKIAKKLGDRERAKRARSENSTSTT